jgi:hypothetical protein
MKGDSGMASTIGKFNFECDALGGVLKANTLLLSARCLTDGEVDEYVQMLKDDLDAVSKKLKKAIRNRPSLLDSRKAYLFGKDSKST